MAEAGIDKSIADIRALVASSTYDAAVAAIGTNYAGSGTEVNFADGSYTVYAEREDQKININALDETDYPWIDQLIQKNLTYDDIAKIIAYRGPEYGSVYSVLGAGGSPLICTGPVSCSSDGVSPKHAPYATIEELRLVLNDEVKYNAIKDIVTVYAPVIPGGLTGKYYSHSYEVTWDKDMVLNLSNFCGKVVEFRALKEAKDSGSAPWPPSGTFPGADGSWNGWAEAHDGEFAGGYIAADWTRRSGLDYWAAVFTGYIYIPQDKVGQSITFKMRSENGVRLFIDGTKLIEDWSDRNMGGWPSDNILVAPVVTFSRAGWHQIRVEYYNKDNQNTVQLKWDAYGSDDYVPAEYFGYCPSSYYGRIAYTIPASDPPVRAYMAASRIGTDYNSAGILKIVSTGKAKRSDGTPLAEKKTTSVIQVFNTLTQSTRAEFWSAWFSNYNDFSDGELRNVTWLDSCPTDKDYFDSGAGKMHWEDDYATTPDSVKLGYWDNFNDDVAYTAIMLKGGYLSTLTGLYWDNWDYYWFGWRGFWFPRDVTPPLHTVIFDSDTRWDCTFGDVSLAEGYNGTYCLRMDCTGNQWGGDPWHQQYPQEREAEVNGNFYSANAQLGYDVFARTYVYDNGQRQGYDGQWHRPPSKRPANQSWEPWGHYLPSWLVGYLVIKDDPYVEGQPKPTGNYVTFVNDGDDDFWGADSSELDCPPPPAHYTTESDTYSVLNNEDTQYYILAAIGAGTSYQAYYSYNRSGDHGWVTGESATAPDAFKPGVVKFKSNNLWYADLDLFWDGDPANGIPAHTNDAYIESLAARSSPYWGSNSESVTDFDNVRVIYPKGYIVSVPLIAKPPLDNSSIIWDTITWNDANPNPANTSITMYARVADTPSASDDFSTTYAKGDSLSSLSGRKFQYKALLGTTTLNSNDYSASSSTPVLKGVTVMYHRPKARIFYRQ